MNNMLMPIAKFLFWLGTIVGSILVLFLLIFRLSGSLPTIGATSTLIKNTPIASNQPDITDPEFYDNFKNKVYEGKFNDSLWSIYGGNVNYSAKAIQKDGMLILSDSDPVVGEGIILYLQKWNEDTFTV